MASTGEVLALIKLFGGGGGSGGGTASNVTFKGVVATKNDLPTTANNGDQYVVNDLDPSTPGAQSGYATWSSTSATWGIVSSGATSNSQLANDEFYLSSKVTGTQYVDNIHIDGNVSTHTATTTNPHEYIISSMQMKRGTAASLSAYVPKAGEPVFEQSGSTYKLKIGNGSLRYVDLPYIGGEYELSADGQSILKVGTQLQVYGFASAAAGSVPRKVSGGLQWVKLEDAYKLVANGAIELVHTVDASNNVTDKIKVKVDEATVQIVSDKLHVPFDGTTIKKKVDGTWGAVQPVAGNGIKFTSNTEGQTVVNTNLVAGRNVYLTQQTDGSVKIDADGGGTGSGDKVVAGKGINITTNAAGDKVISGNYIAGENVELVTTGNTIKINMKTESITNTNRPVRVNGTEVLSKSPNSGYIGFNSSNTSSATGVQFTNTSVTGGQAVGAEIMNKNIIQAGATRGGRRTFKDLDGNVVIFSCGGANF